MELAGQFTCTVCAGMHRFKRLESAFERKADTRFCGTVETAAAFSQIHPKSFVVIIRAVGQETCRTEMLAVFGLVRRHQSGSAFLLN